MKLVLFGTGPFAVPAFDSLIQSPHDVAALVTRPISDAGKRRKTSENPCRDWGAQQGLEILDPANANATEFVECLKEFQADLFVVCDYGQILSANCLGAARKGGINLHGSLLPRYRGAAPINWAIYHGEILTGVTIIHMTAQLDGGPTLAQASLQIGPTETPIELEPRLARLGVDQVHHSIELLEKWDGQSPLGTRQDPSQATKAPRLKKSDGLIDWSRSAEQIASQIRAFQPWPGTYSFLTKSNQEPERLLFHRAVVVAASDSKEILNFSDTKGSDKGTFSPGTVVNCGSDRLWIATAAGILSMLSVQPAGKREMPIADFLRGHAIAQGDRFQ
jgi:methionyl-tRNA formyltransferase